MAKKLYSMERPKDCDLEQLNTLLNRYCLSLTQSVWDSEDLVQDTWIKTLEKIDGGKHANPEALLLRTAKNTWIDQLRRQKVLDRILQEKRNHLQEENVLNRESDRFDLELAFKVLLERLSPLQRTVFLMRNVFGYSVAETAKVLRTTEGAVKSACHRALKELCEVDWNEVNAQTDMAEEEHLKVLLRTLAAAYEAGDISGVLRLVQGEDSVAHAIGIFSAKVRRGIKTYVHASSTQADMMMAA